jgi:cardiolipin synthase A/B
MPVGIGEKLQGSNEQEVEQRYRRVLEGLLGIPATGGNRVDVLRNGVQIFPAMLEAIADARHTVDFATYIYWTGDIADRFAEALSDRARAGVRVRVLLDAIGALKMSRELIDSMEEAGCTVEWFRRPPDVKRLRDTNNRTHRKVLICDEEVAFTGGVGIAEEWDGDARNPNEWRDTHVRVRGPAVDGLRAAFISNWAETGRPLFDDSDRFPEQPEAGPSVVQTVHCPSVIGWSEMTTVVTAMLQIARRTVRLTSAYFVPDDTTSDPLCEAAGRGVQVEVLVPGPHTDKRVVQLAGENHYERLLDAGVRIYRYQPTMLHAKVLSVDGKVATVGSANFDPRSLGHNEEANIVVFDSDVIDVLDQHFEEDLRRSEPVDPAEWKDRGPLQRAAEKVTELIDDQL